MNQSNWLLKNLTLFGISMIWYWCLQILINANHTCVGSQMVLSNVQQRHSLRHKIIYQHSFLQFILKQEAWTPIITYWFDINSQSMTFCNIGVNETGVRIHFPYQSILIGTQFVLIGRIGCVTPLHVNLCTHSTFK